VAGVAALYVGGVVGAGFASGREVLQFFAAYGRFGLAGAALAGGLLGWIGARILTTAVRVGAAEHRTLFLHLFGRRLGWAMDQITTASIFVGLGAVLAGAGSLLNEQLGWPPILGAAAFALLVGAVLMAGIRGLLGANLALAPGIVLYILAAGAAALHRPEWAPALAAAVPDPHLAVGGWYVGATLYAAYNALLAAVALSAAAPALASTAAARRAGWAGGATLGILALAATVAVLPAYGRLAPEPVPLLEVARADGPGWLGAYLLMLWAALLTTALASAYALGARLGGPGAGARRVTLLGLAAALPLSVVGFTALVRWAYPAMGYAGLVLLGAIMFHTARPPSFPPPPAAGRTQPSTAGGRLPPVPRRTAPPAG
jgi:uncharacterized membrane protein YkvI